MRDQPNNWSLHWAMFYRLDPRTGAKEMERLLADPIARKQARDLWRTK